MQNIINNKRERDAKNIIITLGKSVDGYYYFGDSLQERSKIKIPLDEISRGESFQFREADSVREKSEKSKQLNGSVISIVPEEIKEQKQPVQFPKLEIEEIPLLAKLVEKNTKHQIVLPSCSQWFTFEDVHEIEMKSLPEFFCGKYPSKTPDVYKEYRNYIINLYRENPNSYLSATGIF